MKRQNYNSGQQPWNRGYRRDHRQYERDEERDFARGADYLPTREYSEDPYYRSPEESYPMGHEDQRRFGDRIVAPVNDYGYRQGEYHSEEPWREPVRRGPAVGYGNEFSPQASDFDNWLHSDNRFRNFRNDDYARHEFDRNQVRGHNRGFEEGLVFRDEWEGSSRANYSDDDRLPHVDRFHNRTGRHMEIVRPFKRDEDYGRNDYNESIGWGNNQMVFHNDPRPDRRYYED